jgi:hypothetical protein
MRHFDHLAELSGGNIRFVMIESLGASLISEFLVVMADLNHPPEHQSSTTCISIVRILKTEHNLLAFTPFEQKEFDDGRMLLPDVHCDFFSFTISTNA